MSFKFKEFTLVLLFILIFTFSLTSCKEEYTLKNKEIKAQEIFTQLQKYTSLPGQLPPLIIDPSEDINAYASAEGIAITVGMLKIIHNDSEIAFVLGHELGHFYLGHLVVDDGYDSRMHEANADKFGAFLAIRAGYDPCAGSELWNRILNYFGNSIVTNSHPSFADRIQNLTFPLCPVLRS